MALVALLATALPNADAALGRMATYLQKPFAASFTVTRGDMPGTGTGSITVQRPNRMIYTMKWGPQDYELYWTENRTLEVVRGLKLYYESGPFPRLYQPESRMSDLPVIAFPLAVLAADLRTIYAGVTLKLVGEETVGGIACDHVKGGTGPGYDVWIAKDGRPMRFRYDAESPTGTVSVKFEFSKWSSAADINISRFEPVVPAGFQPHALPRDPYPIQPGTPFPVDGWIGPRNSTASLKFDRPTLIVVTSSECEVSARAASTLRELESTAAIWTFTDNGRPPSALGRYPTYRDASMRTLPRLLAPGTPLFYLVGKDGRILKAWYGFSRAKSAEFVRSIKEAAS